MNRTLVREVFSYVTAELTLQLTGGVCWPEQHEVRTVAPFFLRFAIIYTVFAIHEYFACLARFRWCSFVDDRPTILQLSSSCARRARAPGTPLGLQRQTYQWPDDETRVETRLVSELFRLILTEKKFHRSKWLHEILANWFQALFFNRIKWRIDKWRIKVFFIILLLSVKLLFHIILILFFFNEIIVSNF